MWRRQAIASSLISEGFDTAYSYKPLHHPLGHAFTHAIFYLDYDRPAFPIRSYLFHHCYGRKVLAQRGGLPTFDRELKAERSRPTAPTPKRLFALGPRWPGS